MDYLQAFLLIVAAAAALSIGLVAFANWPQYRADRLAKDADLRRKAEDADLGVTDLRRKTEAQHQLGKMIEGVVGPAPAWYSNLQKPKWGKYEMDVIAAGYGKLSDDALTLAVRYAGGYDGKMSPRSLSAVRNKAHRMGLERGERLTDTGQRELYLQLTGRPMPEGDPE